MGNRETNHEGNHHHRKEGGQIFPTGDRWMRGTGFCPKTSIHAIRRTRPPRQPFRIPASLPPLCWPRASPWRHLGWDPLSPPPFDCERQMERLGASAVRNVGLLAALAGPSLTSLPHAKGNILALLLPTPRPAALWGTTRQSILPGRAGHGKAALASLETPRWNSTCLDLRLDHSPLPRGWVP